MSFKNFGNERSYKCNSEVLDNLKNAVTATAVMEKDRLIGEDIDLLEERNRKLRIANFLEASWLTVKHYESSVVAWSSKDDKKFRAAKKKAVREHGRNKKKRNVELSQGRGSQYSTYGECCFGQRNRSFRPAEGQFRQQDPFRGCYLA